MTVHILIVDDHPVVRLGLRGMLEAYDDLRVVSEAGSGDEATVLAAATRPDVILMDLRMPGADGATATARIRQEHPGVRVLVLTTYEGDADILPAIEADVTGYLLKDTPIGTLTDAIRAAARGETVLAPPVAARLVTHMQAPAGEQLTPCEVQVPGLVARGLSNSEIGRQLYIGEATVKTHLLRTFVKLGVNDRTAAVTVALSRGILTSPHQ
ncbi:response regulator transcription factor [Streptomyces tailanensis]|uniref:response regulator transcription factor n=1 Tax=Streptomyces tailanensis TaxID=2569858 RepID=UPI00122DF624|nr:response regulator transcription factor [Streptomyces tailanensis]